MKKCDERAMDETIKAYDQMATHYRKRAWSIPYLNSIIAWLEGKKCYVGDLGCGTGQYTRYFLSRTRVSVKFVALDLSYNMVKELYNSLGSTEKYRVLPVVADLVSLPIADESLSIALAIAVIHHILPKELRKRALAEIYRVISRNGLILITVWALVQPYFIFYLVRNALHKIVSRHKCYDVRVYVKRGRYRRYYYLYTMRELVSEASSAGFIVLKSGAFYQGKGLLKPRKNYFVIATKSLLQPNILSNA